jgi:acetylornithine deacetylase/succinyl-diaminopimelate desuccinylase-like protein
MEVEDILSELIKIRSVNPPGGEMEVAYYLKQLFDSEGVPSEIITSSGGRGNFISYIGEGERSLLYLSHIDVVPPGEGWEFDPFCGRIEGGLVHGRGALDCKGLVASEAYATLKLAKEKLSGRLIFAATADEERGGKEGIRYLIQNHHDKILADFALNEGGEGPRKIGNKVVYFMQVGEKGCTLAHLKSKGVSCHASLPGLGENAIVRMAKAVEDLACYKPSMVLIDEVKELIKGILKIKGLETEPIEGNVDTVIQDFEDREFREYLRALTRMTVSPNIIHGGIKTNVVPDSCHASVDIRVLPSQDEEYVIKEIRKVVGEDVQIDIPNYSAPSFSPSKCAYSKLIENTIKEISGEIYVLPCISSGATDSRFLRSIGIPCYGLDIFDSNLRSGMHGKNERIDIESLRLKSDFLIRLAQNYLK